MAKKKKTLKQKKLAELRHLEESEKILTTLPTSQPTLSYSFSGVTKEEKNLPTYSLQHDLKKTLAVSFVILVCLLTLSVLLHNHAFVLPLVSRY